MKDVWTGEAAAIMHVHDISALTLASKLNWNPKYLSSVLNCASPDCRGSRAITKPALTGFTAGKNYK